MKLREIHAKTGQECLHHEEPSNAVSKDSNTGKQVRRAKDWGRTASQPI